MLDQFTLHRRAAKVLPPAIRTSGVVADDDPCELSKLLFPLRRKSQGALVYRLTAESVAAMSEDPLVYLKDAVQAREGPSRRRAPFAYREWRKTTLPGFWTSLWVPHAIPVNVDETVNAYFTTKTDRKALLVVIPAQRVAFYIWCA
jgi:hypothetical protein